ncbi:MAG: hypothetical protein OEZ28_12575 [Nitrospinota bacterium]|nr:hypothetical protein [Nitrospinota bacterium]
MPKLFYITFMLILVWDGSGCAVFQKKADPNISGFIELLTRTSEPTLAEYAKYSGECGGEGELVFELDLCRIRGYEIKSEGCIDFVRHRCHSADHEQSLELGWIRERFFTVGKQYRLVSIRQETEGVKHNLIEILIGTHLFLLFHALEPDPPGGRIIGVVKVDSKRIYGNL